MALIWLHTFWTEKMCVFDSQLQQLHHDLVAFCSELKNMDGHSDTETLDSQELKRCLLQAEDRLKDKKHSLQTLKENLSTAATQKDK